MSPELAVWVSGGKRDRVLRVVVERRLRGVEEDSKQGEEQNGSLRHLPVYINMNVSI